MSNDSYVTHEECEKYRKEIYDKMNSQDIRVTIIETKFKTMITLLLLILAPTLSTAVVTIMNMIIN